jgi:hypothetical protein
MAAWWLSVVLSASAETQGVVPVMGQVVDAGGVPLAGTHTLEVSLFEQASGGDSWWSDSLEAEFSAGGFAIALGSGDETLDLEQFGEHADLWMEIAVDGGAPAERVRVGRAPLAAHAVRASVADAVGSVQSGDVATTADVSAVESSLSAQISALASDLAADFAGLASALNGDFSSLSSTLDLRIDDVEDRTTELESHFAVGMIAFFPGVCPIGWGEYTAARGRMVLALPASGVAEATQGTALGNLGQVSITQVPAHAHTVDPPATASGTESAGHTHSVDPPNTTSSGQSADHSHTVDPPNTGTNHTGDHNHGMVTRQDDYNVSGGSGPSFGADNGPYTTHGSNYTTTNGGHSHVVDIGAFGSSGASVDHSHNTDIGAFNSAGASASHTHTTDIGSFTSGSVGAASVDVTMPYIQLRACQYQGTP